MHMADALLSPEVGGAMWISAGALLAYSAKKVKQEINDKKIPLMGIMGAFIFAAQMINFTIPGTGSSGHIGGGMILAILLGPYASIVVMASILAVQALFFADGGLLALGCNIINLGLFPCYVAYPLIYKKIVNRSRGTVGIFAGSIISVITALQLGALLVVLETVASGISDLPFKVFLITMLPIHLAIGVIEGVVTAIVVNFIRSAEPEIFALNDDIPRVSMKKKLLFGMLAVTIATGGILSWFASENPDGLEWSISRVTGKTELATPAEGIHGLMNNIQKKISMLPDYGYNNYSNGDGANQPIEKITCPAVKSGKTLSGILGSVITIFIISITGYLLRRKKTAS